MITSIKLLLMLVMVFIMIQFSVETQTSIVDKPAFIITEPEIVDESPSYEQEVYNLLCLYKIQNKYIVLAQAKLESGDFTSNIFLKSNNVVNMKVPGQRPTLAKKCDHSYAEYESIEHGIIDYALWQCAYARGLTEEQYFKRLVEVGFAEDTLYIHKLRPIVKQLKEKYGE